MDRSSSSVVSASALPNAAAVGGGAVMGDGMPEEPEACIVYPGNFAPSESRVLNHRYVSFRADILESLNL
jgi:hypothetical protein